MSLRVLLLATCLMLAACGPNYKFLGSQQTSLAASACSLESWHCPLFADHLDNQGARSGLKGSYFVTDLGSGNYSLTGKVTFTHSNPAITNLKYLDLTFILFKGDIVAHEEIIRITGAAGEPHEFSRLIKTEIELESSKWAWYTWRASELGVY